jgi:hypothetical protein
MKKRLSKSQIKIFMILSQQKREIQRKMQEIVEAEDEQVKMIAKYFDFPDGNYQIIQDGEEVFIKLLQENENDSINKNE